MYFGNNIYIYNYDITMMITMMITNIIIIILIIIIITIIIIIITIIIITIIIIITTMDLGVTRSIGSQTNSSPTSLLLLEKEVNRKASKKGRGKETNCGRLT